MLAIFVVEYFYFDRFCSKPYKTNQLFFSTTRRVILSTFYQFTHFFFYPFEIFHKSPIFAYTQVKNGHRVDCTTSLKGLTVHCKEERPDMYASIDATAKALASKLQKYRSRRNEGYHAGNSMGQDLMNALDAMELDETAEEDEDVAADLMYAEKDFIDFNAPNIMKVNSFDLENAIPLNEAIFALDYVDHDFFVFKNEETGRPSIVYKRNAGGVGLVEIP